MREIDFSHLRLLAIFATVIETGTFAATARKLNTSRSRISEQVSQLESDLGVRLLQRSTRQLNITSEGQEVYQQARQLPDILQQIEAITTPPEPSGRVAITMNHDIAHKYVLPVLHDFKQQYPQVKLDLILDDTRLDLISEQIDLAIRIGFPRDETIIARKMHQERFSLFASPDFIDKYGEPKSITECEQLPWVLLQQTNQGDVQTMRRRNETIEIKPQDFFRCNSPLAMQQMVVQGLGMGALLPSTVKQQIEAGQLIAIMPTLSSDPLTFSLVYPSRRQIPLRTRVVIDYLLAANIFG